MPRSNFLLNFPWNRQQKVMYMIAGCNGAGKTTAFKNYLAEKFGNPEFANADEIAREMCPSNPRSVDLEAAKRTLTKVNQLLEGVQSFCVETTLAAKSYRPKIQKAHENGFKVALFFYWIDVETAKKRVAQRVKEGGHAITDDEIESHYHHGLENLETIYKPIVDIWEFMDNTSFYPRSVSGGALPCYHIMQKEWINQDAEEVSRFIFDILTEKAQREEDVVYSFDGRNITLSAYDAKWIYNKLYSGIEDWEWQLLTELATNDEDMIYYFDTQDVAIPARNVLSILRDFGHRNPFI